MEGVVVSAKRPASTIMVSVSTDAQGQYSFPQDRLAPGAYDITIRAIGYTLKPTVATVHRAAPCNSTLGSRRPRLTFSPFKCPTASGFKARRARRGRS